MTNKYLISVDIEGITGVSSTDFSSSSGKKYALAQKYMASDTNAVVKGILEADPKANILIRDAHSSAANLDLEKLHQAAEVLQGWGDEMNMLSGLDNTFKGVFLVGYHAGAQNNISVLAHTYCRHIHYIKINGKIINETGIAALYAGYHDVPITFISGDDHTIKEAKSQLAKNFTGIAVKKTNSRDSALSYSLTKAAELLTNGAKEATTNLLYNKIAPTKFPLPLKMEISLFNIGYTISLFQKIYGLLVFDKAYQFDQEEFSIKFTAQSALEFFSRLNLIVCLIFGIIGK